MVRSARTTPIATISQVHGFCCGYLFPRVSQVADPKSYHALIDDNPITQSAMKTRFLIATAKF